MNYYDLHASEYAEQSLKADMSRIQSEFESLLPEQSYILDCGCGAGRDTRDFLKYGYKVLPVDASAEMCRITTELTGVAAQRLSFEEIEYEDTFDGIWACASLLHVERSRLPDVLNRLNRALKHGGILYMSFKYGDFDGYRDDRYYTDINEAAVDKLICADTGWELIRSFISADKMGNRNGLQWMNVFARKAP